MPANTPTLSLPYPVPADTVDVPRDIQALATKLDGFSSLQPPLVSVLPGGPADGQEVYFLANAASGTVWHLRYRTASLRWEFLGGPALFSEVVPREGTASTAFVDLATVGPQITLPAPGDYDITVECLLTPNPTADAFGLACVQYGAVASAGDGVAAQNPANGNMSVSVAHTVRRSRGTAGEVIKMVYRTTVGTAIFERRALTIRPVRL